MRTSQWLTGSVLDPLAAHSAAGPRGRAAATGRSARPPVPTRWACQEVDIETCSGRGTLATVAMLEQLGYRVHAVSDAEAALEAIGRRSFDLVVSDIVMPGSMDGIALARVVRERQPDLPVLLVTGYTDAAGEASAEFTVMRKPFQLADLSRKAARLIVASKQSPTSNVVPLRDARPGTASRQGQ